MPICLPTFAGAFNPSASVPSNTKSVSFDGTNDHMTIGTNVLFNTGSAFSYSGWVKLDSYTPAYQTISQFKTNHSNGFKLLLSNTGNYTGLNIGSNDTSNMIKVRTSGDISSTFTNWTHIAMTYNGSGASTSSNYKIYINGSEVSTTSNGNLISFNNVNTIGAANDGASFPTNGLIDEVAIFNAELSSSDVTAIYNSGVPASLTSYSPAGWWRMGDGSDGSGNADGTVVGGLPQIYNVAEDGSGNRITGIDGSLTNIASPNGIVADVPT